MESIKDLILKRISRTTELDIGIEFLCEEPDFNESFSLNPFDSLIMQIKGHSPIKGYRFSFEKFNNWATENNIDVVDSNKSPNKLILRLKISGVDFAINGESKTGWTAVVQKKMKPLPIVFGGELFTSSWRKQYVENLFNQKDFEREYLNHPLRDCDYFKYYISKADFEYIAAHMRHILHPNFYEKAMIEDNIRDSYTARMTENGYASEIDFVKGQSSFLITSYRSYSIKN